MMVKQYAFTFDGLVLVEGDLFCYKIEWMLYDTKKKSFHCVGIFWPFFTMEHHGIIFLFVVIEY
jgi:hypothetical protein